MSLPATTVFEVRNGGSDTQCSGGFNSARGGTDYTLQAAAQATGTVTVSGTTCTATTGIFTSAMVGNTITDGAGNVREITAFTSSTVVTLDSTVAWSGATVYVGGALASPGQAGAYATVSGMVVFVKYNASAFVATSASTNVAAGCVAMADGVTWCGYDTTRTVVNTDANRPTFQVNSGLSAATLFNTSSGGNLPLLRRFILDGNSQTTSRGVRQAGVTEGCKIINCTNNGVAQSASGAVVSGCEFTGCATQPACSVDVVFGSESYANSVSGFANVVAASHCLSYGNTGASSDGFGSSGGLFDHCVAYGNGRDGFHATFSAMTLIDCIAEANAAFGYRSNSLLYLRNSASYTNTSGRTGGSPAITEDVGAITGSGSFFTNAAGNDFSLNNTAGAGALCRAAGYPATFPRGTTASYADVGAAQHQDSGGGSSGGPPPPQVFGSQLGPLVVF